MYPKNNQYMMELVYRHAKGHVNVIIFLLLSESSTVKQIILYFISPLQMGIKVVSIFSLLTSSDILICGIFVHFWN